MAAGFQHSSIKQCGPAAMASDLDLMEILASASGNFSQDSPTQYPQPPKPPNASPSSRNKDQFVSDVLEFVRGMIEDNPSLETIAQTFNSKNTNQNITQSSGSSRDATPMSSSPTQNMHRSYSRTGPEQWNTSTSSYCHDQDITIKQEIQDKIDSNQAGVSSSPDRMNSASVSSHDSSPMTQSDRFIPHTPHRTPHDIIRNHGDATTPSLGSPGHPSSVGSMSPLQDSDSRDGNYGNSTNSSDFYSNPYTEDLEEKMFFNGQAISKEGGKRCQICNDVASGFHYGVWSCEGCKAFFKRSLQGPVDYVCPATNNCTIDKHRRKSCQACRLRKCIETGMSRGNCREKKGVRQYQRHSKKRHTSSDCEVIESKLPKLNSEVSPGRKEPQVCPVRPIVDANGNRPPSCQAPTLPPPPIHPLVEHLMKIDPPVRFSNHSLCEPETAEIILGTLLKLIDTELTDVVAWARGIPGYMSLPLQGHMQLLELSWLELLTLGLIWRSIPHDHILACAPDLHLSQARVGRAEYWPIMKKVLFLVNTVKQLKVNREEMVLLRACVLLNAGVTQLSEDENYQDLQNKIHGALHYTVISRHQGSTSRLSRLLLLLPQLRQISLEFWSYLSDLHHNNKLPRDCTLVGEILATRKISLHL